MSELPALPFEPPSAAELGKPTRKAATAALQAHREVVGGAPLRQALSAALAEQPGLGGQERRYAALACRELSRHQRLLDLAAKAVGHPPSRWTLPADAVLVRYVLWRRLFTRAAWAKVANEVALPGPLRPRSIKDPVLEEVATAPLTELALPEAPVERAAALFSFPRWLAEALAAEVPAEEVEPLFAALDREPDLCLRARPPGTRDELLQALGAEGISAEALPFAPDGIRILDPGGRVFDTRAMKAQRLQVQDLGSQLIVEACLPAPGGGWSGARIADVCAGAGGKTAALADRVGRPGAITAGDVSWRRLDEAKRRLGKMKVTQVRLAVPASARDQDVVLIDAPCSGTGALGREPDQKWKLTQKKVDALLATQRGLLDRVAAELRPGGLLVYATCSLLRSENEAQVEAFLARHPSFGVEDMARVLPPEVCRGGFLRLFPHRAPGAGFFAARLRKAGG